MNIGRQKYTVFDMTHGGSFIARSLANMGHTVRAADVYGTLNKEDLAGLLTCGIEIAGAKPDFDDKDVVIAPVHLNPEIPVYKSALKSGAKIITHHKAVGIILSRTGSLEGKQVFEITGSKGKTSTSFLLAAILSKKKTVLLHTSGGLYHLSPDRKSLLKRELSIAPASILEAISIAQERELAVDIFIFEISLGGTGLADIGIITTLNPEYGIANNTRNSGDAKLQMIRNAKPEAKIIINCEDSGKISCTGPKNKIRTFGIGDACDADVTVTVSPDSLTLNAGSESFNIPVRSGYDPSAYSTAFAASACAALEAEVDVNTIADAFAGFTGVEGRMIIADLQGRKYIDNSSSGLTICDAETALKEGVGPNKKTILVIGEHAAQVCEGLPPEGVGRLVDKYYGKIDTFILVGERMRCIGSDKAIYCSNLDEGIKHALASSSVNDTIVSCVKCFR